MRGVGLLAVLAFAALSGCINSDATPDQCVNPYALRVKIGDTFFDFPQSMYIDFSTGEDGESRAELKLGLLRLKSPEGRQVSVCNKKASAIPHVEGVQYTFIDDNGKKRVRGGIWHQSSDTPYLADVEDIEEVKLVGSGPVKQGLGVYSDAFHEFEHQGKRWRLGCQIWDDSKHESFKDRARPAFPLFCSPPVTFKSGNLLISSDQETFNGGFDRDNFLIPPEQWPEQWAYVINKIMSYRVFDAQGGK